MTLPTGTTFGDSLQINSKRIDKLDADIFKLTELLGRTAKASLGNNESISRLTEAVVVLSDLLEKQIDGKG